MVRKNVTQFLMGMSEPKTYYENNSDRSRNGNERISKIRKHLIRIWWKKFWCIVRGAGEWLKGNFEKRRHLVGRRLFGLFYKLKRFVKTHTGGRDNIERLTLQRQTDKSHTAA